jgi:hypothetical protein
MTELDHIVVIGAGASFGARFDAADDDRPPLGAQLPHYLHAWLQRNPSWVSSHVPRQLTIPDFRQSRTVGRSPRDTIDSFLRDALRLRSFEKAMNSWLDDPESAAFSVELINRLVAYSFLGGDGCACGARADLYDRFLRDYCGLPNAAASVQLISFNYELLLEEAVVRVMNGASASATEVVEGVIEDAVEYAGLKTQFSHSRSGQLVCVSKPHGSINWLDPWSSPGSMSNDQRPESRPSSSGVGLDHGVAYVCPGGRANLVDHLRNGNLPIILAQYSRGKPVAANSSVIDEVRARCLRDISAAKSPCITVIGLLPPKDVHDDPFLLQLFKAISASDGAKHYVSPSRDDCARASKFGLTAHQVTFDAFLDAHVARIRGIS